MESQGIRYRLSEEAVQFKISVPFEEMNWDKIMHRINGPIQQEAAQVDHSFETFR